MTRHLHDGRVGYKVTFRDLFRDFGFLNNSCIGKKGIILLLLSSSRDKFTLL